MIRIKLKTKKIIRVGEYIYTSPDSNGFGMVPEDIGKVAKVLHVYDSCTIQIGGLRKKATNGKVYARIQDIRLATEEEIELHKRGEL